MSIKSKIAARKNAGVASTSSEPEDVGLELTNLRRELAESRAKLGEIEKEREHWRTKAEQSEARYTSEKIRRSLYSAASAAGAIDPDDVVDLVINRGARIEGDRVVFGQGAEAKDATAFVSTFVESKPHLRKSAPVSQGTGAPSTQASNAPAVAAKKPLPDRRDAAAMSAYYQDEIRERIASAKGSKPNA